MRLICLVRGEPDTTTGDASPAADYSNRCSIVSGPGYPSRMPGDERTDFGTPIPLRDNGSGVRPNPWSRLEAVDVVYQRLRVLAQLTASTAGPPDEAGLAGVLEALSNDLRGAIWGSLADVERLANSAGVGRWTSSAYPIVWPDGPLLDEQDARSVAMLETIVVERERHRPR